MSKLNDCKIVFNPVSTREEVKRIITSYCKSMRVFMFKDVPKSFQPIPDNKKCSNEICKSA